MKIVIQCAARKHPSAGRLRTADGREILLVAQPDLAPPEAAGHYARPDDVSDDGRTWRERLVACNAAADNPLNLLPAYRLYTHDAYRALANRFGLERLFILSAGWELIPANFLTPGYDITFATSADEWKRRHNGDHYEDFRMLPDDEGPIVFVGGKDYMPLFGKLTASLGARKLVFFNSRTPPDLPHGFEAIRYSTTTRTNWHYECARHLASGTLETLDRFETL
jgi:hypothetical protein